MKGTFAVASVVGGLVVCGLVGRAVADDNLDAPDNPLQTPGAQPLRTYEWVANGVPSYNGYDQVHAAAGFSNVIYLNNCKPGGCQMKVGYDNSLTNTSQIPNSASTVQPFAYSDSVWQQVVTCVKATYAPFGVTIVDQRPTSGNYHMAVVAGRPQDIGEPSGVGGVSPFGCGYLPNAISYSFANIYGGSVDDICWTVAQETAHSWGLDHKFDNRDPMTYLQSGPSRKSYQNESGACGEYNARSCQCGGSTMNSYQAILNTFGGSTPTPPTIKITEPQEGATNLQPMFAIKSTATDDIGISKVELKIDGQLVSTLTSAPYQWAAPSTLAQGNHTIEITAYDVGNTPASDTVHASLGMPCDQASDCENPTDVCVDGRCVRGGGVGGGLGTTCTNNTDCASGMCAADADGNHYCVEPCDPTQNGCPGGFGCVATGGSGGVCWPGADSGQGTCSAGGHAAPGFLLMGIAALFVTRRRRRR